MNNPTLADRLRDLEENPTVVSFYVKRNCKKCLGRGTIAINARNELGVFVNTTHICDCVIKALKKELQELAHG